MTATAHILADGARDLFELVPIILFVVLGIVVHSIKKRAARRAWEAQRQRPEQRPGQPAQSARQVTREQAGYGQRPQDGGQPQPGRPQPGQTARPAGPPPAPPPRPDLELAREALRSMGLIVEQPTQRAPQADQPVALTPVEPQTIRVEEELKLQRRRERKLDAQRRKRLAPRKVPEADSAAIEGRILKVRPGQEAAHDVATGVIVDLSRAESLRRAIIFHEIFSAPKALREGKEMWDV